MKSIVLALTFLLSGPSAASEVFELVAHRSTATESLTRAEVSKMFMRSLGKWPSGERVEAVDRSPKSEICQDFSKEIHGKDCKSIKAYWEGQIFSGKGVGPKRLIYDKEVLEFVREKPGRIGYVRKGSHLPEGVKVLEITD